MGIKDILLSEKISKMEINSALKSTNVMIGAEFEFNIPKFEEKYNDIIEKFDQMQTMEIEQLDYDEAFEQWMAIPNNKAPLPKPPEWALEAGYEYGEEIPPPTEIYPELKVHKDEVFRLLIRKFVNLESLPFKNMIVSPDHMKKSATKWVIKPDGSLGLSGLEIVSPILTLKEFLQITPKMFEWIETMGGEIGDECGFHISMSLKNVTNLGEALDVTKLSLFLDEGYIYNFFKMREFNTYAKSAHDTVSKAFIAMNSPKLAEQLIDEFEIKKKYPKEHYMAINIEHLGSANEYIEFRYVGGNNYHRKWDRIKNIVAHYVYNLSLACDPTFKKKEYEHKMARLLNKIQYFTVCAEMTKMISDTEIDRKSSQVKKEWANLWNTWRSLYHYKEAVDKDKKTEHGRKGFLRMCAMLGIKEGNMIWDFSNNRILV